MTQLCAGRTAIVTGAGGGLGREYALALAAAGANVIVNDINADTGAATVARIAAAGGGRALLNTGDITAHSSAGKILDAALDTFGNIDAIVNNAGVCRDRTFASMTEAEWDQVIQVHLKGHFCLAQHAACYWRQQAKTGASVTGRIINTSSGAGLLGSVGQSNYSAAKGGILSLTLVQAAELARYGITANVLAPQARTGMTEEVFAEMMQVPEDGSFDLYHPGNVAPLVVWLVSEASASVTGRCFEIFGGKISIATGWRHGYRREGFKRDGFKREGLERDKGERWLAEELSQVIPELLAAAPAPEPVYGS